MTRILASLPLMAAACAGPDTDPLDTSDGPVACPDYDAADSYPVQVPALTEASGLVAGVSGDVLWTHNDSGDSARLFAVSVTGQDLGTVQISGVAAVDWEDIARIDIDGRSVLVIADVGDNAAQRTDAKLILVDEPVPPGAGQSLRLAASRVVPLSYASGPVDAEAVAVDPLDGSLIILSKTDLGSDVFVAAPGWWDEPELTLASQAVVPFGSERLPGSPTATGADVSADGRLVVVRTYTGAWVFRRAQGPLIGAFDSEPCEAPAALEQGEAIAFLGDSYLTLPEGQTPPLVYYSP